MKFTQLNNAKKLSFQDVKNLTIENIELERALSDSDVCITLFRNEADEVEFECTIDKFELAELIGLETSKPRIVEFLDGNTNSYISERMYLINDYAVEDFEFTGYENEIIEHIKNTKIKWEK